MITTRSLKLNGIIIGNYLQKRSKAPSKVGFGLQVDRMPELKEKCKRFIITSDRVCKE
jgi:hypothetical protein